MVSRAWRPLSTGRCRRPEQGVGAVPAADHVVAATAVDPVVTAEADDDVASRVPTSLSLRAVPTMVARMPWQVGGPAACAPVVMTTQRHGQGGGEHAGGQDPRVGSTDRPYAQPHGKYRPRPAALREPSQRVSPRARALWLVAAVAEGAVLVAIAVVAAAFDLVGWWVVAVAWSWWPPGPSSCPRWRYLVHRWEVTETAVYTQTGW